MGVVLAEDFADDLGALAGGAVGREAQLAHPKQDAAVDGLEAVANVGEGAADDDAHRVIDIGAPHLIFDVDGNVAAAALDTAGERWFGRTLWGNILICHVF